MTLPGQLNPTPRILLGPGPSNAHPRVIRAMATPLIGHLDPEFIGIMEDVKSMLQQVFRTKNALTFPVSATGSAGMEAILTNLLESGDEALICVNGVFGNRMADIVERLGATLHRVDAPWGKWIEPEQVKEALGKCKPKAVAIVHAETSTGVLQPLEEIGKLVHDAGALFLVDTVTSLGGTDVRVDDWGIDAVYSGTQKCLSAPPGLAPVSFSDRAVEAIRARKTKVQSWYLDTTMLINYWSGEKRAYHHTAPISSIYSLYEALRIVLEEGLESRFERHQKNHELLKAGLEDLGFEFLVPEGYRLPMLNAVKLPQGFDDAGMRKTLLDRYNIEVGAGLGEFAGKVWRIGLMGYGSNENHVNALISALRQVL
ncbi:MAG: alanine--glyoxylate aminotransferase family protein, partial [Candidatus Omnitrophica bacterium]|nr:alanine--glyoxylate aminotransferase family protein [Candidatus Omnitrophota bacterium]